LTCHLGVNGACKMERLHPPGRAETRS
jgi:hypothetical protein